MPQRGDIRIPASLALLVAVSMLALLLGSGGPPTADLASAQSAAGPISEIPTDVEDDETPANAATSVGTIETCVRIDNNDTLDQDEDTADVVEVDVVADGGGIPPYNDAGTGADASDDFGALFGFGLEFNFDLAVVQVNAVDQKLLSASLPSVVFVVNSGGPFPNTSGVSALSQIETSVPLSGSAESGEGVLARFELEGIGAGLAALSLGNVGVLDVANVVYDITSINSEPGTETTFIAVDQDCPGPESDLKVNSVSVDAPGSEDVNTAFDVTVTANVHNNGDVGPTDADVIVDLTVPTDCTRTPDNSQTVAGTPLEVSVGQDVPQTWTVTCGQPSAHQFEGSATVIVAQQDVSDPDDTNDTGVGQATTNVLDTADVKVQGVTVDAPASANTGDPFDVTVTANVHNNGSFGPTDADVEVDLTVPTDCTRTPDDPQTVQGTPLEVSVDQDVQQIWSVTCSQGGTHVFEGSTSLTLNHLHVSDSDGGNNSGQGQATSDIIKLYADADVKVQSVSVGTPDSVDAGVPFDVTVAATVHNNGPFGPVNVDTRITLNLPSDCSTFIREVVLEDGSLGVSVAAAVPLLTFSVICAEPSSHDFTATAVITVDDQAAIDPDTANNTLTSPAATMAVTKTADFKVTGVGVTAPLSAATGVPFDVTVDAFLHNNGPDSALVDATVTLTMPGDCITGDNPKAITGISLPVSVDTALPTQTFSVTCADKSFHEFGATVALSVPIHVIDPAPGNDSASADPSTVPVIGPADLKVSGMTVSASTPAVVDTPFDLTVSVAAHNNGPVGPVDSDLTVTLSLPADCSTSDSNPQAVNNVSVPVSALGTTVPVTWSVTCTSHSLHSFFADGSIAVNDLHVVDPDDTNDSAQSGPADVPVFVHADGKIVSSTILDPPSSIPTGIDIDITVRKVLHNNGPYSTASFDLSNSAEVPASCTATPPSASSHDLAASTAITIDEVWVINCSSTEALASFRFDNILAVTSLHVADPDSNNNTKSVFLTLVVDTDSDGIPDATETICGSNPSDGTSIPERVDGTFAGVDDDKDGPADEPLPLGADGYDCDGDGYVGIDEAHVYNTGASTTPDQDPCGNDGWASDLFSSGASENRVDLQDAGSFIAPVPRLDTSLGDAFYDVRWDLTPGSHPPQFLKDINVQDVGTLITGTQGFPPMFGNGPPAFGTPGPICPWPP